MGLYGDDHKHKHDDLLGHVRQQHLRHLLDHARQRHRRDFLDRDRVDDHCFNDAFFNDVDRRHRVRSDDGRSDEQHDRDPARGRRRRRGCGRRVRRPAAGRSDRADFHNQIKISCPNCTLTRPLLIKFQQFFCALRIFCFAASNTTVNQYRKLYSSDFYDHQHVHFLSDLPQQKNMLCVKTFCDIIVKVLQHYAYSATSEISFRRVLTERTWQK